MLKIRVIPCLLLQNQGLVKTVRFKDPTYIGDPINAVRIFNTKEVHELIFLDITSTREKKSPQVGLITQISDECRMPLLVGGGIRNLEDIRSLLNAGAEKVSLNTVAAENPDFIRAASDEFGSQSIVVSIDVKSQPNGGYKVHTHGGRVATDLKLNEYVRLVEQKGAGEILVNSIDRDGTMTGYDTQLIRNVADAVNIPVIACGGAGSLSDFVKVVQQGHASAVAAGSFFVFHGRRRAVLISFPTKGEIESALGKDEIAFN